MPNALNCSAYQGLCISEASAEPSLEQQGVETSQEKVLGRFPVDGSWGSAEIPLDFERAPIGVLRNKSCSEDTKESGWVYLLVS